MDDAKLVGGSPPIASASTAARVPRHQCPLRLGQVAGHLERRRQTVFFNLNGHTYKGREHWTRLWQYYKDNVDSGYWRPFDIGGAVSGDLAVIWCERHTHSEWVGKDPMPSRPYGKEFISRSTMVFRKEDGDWRVIHVHFSPASEAPRPGGV